MRRLFIGHYYTGNNISAAEKIKHTKKRKKKKKQGKYEYIVLQYGRRGSLLSEGLDGRCRLCLRRALVR